MFAIRIKINMRLIFKPAQSIQENAQVQFKLVMQTKLKQINSPTSKAVTFLLCYLTKQQANKIIISIWSHLQFIYL